MDKEKNNIIVLNGSKSEEPKDVAKLFLDEKMLEFKSFIISGETAEGKRLAFGWNASLDNMIIYHRVMTKSLDNEFDKAIYSNKV